MKERTQMKNLILTALAATSLWLLAPTESAHALDLDGYVCRVNYDAVSGAANFVMYSGPNCTGTSQGPFQADPASEAPARERLLSVLTAAATTDRRVSLNYRRVFFGAYLNFIQNVVVHAD
jgi:hypothetical protein